MAKSISFGIVEAMMADGEPATWLRRFIQAACARIAKMSASAVPVRKERVH